MIGKLDRLMTLQESVLTPDGGGGFTQVWQDVADTPQIYAGILAEAESLASGARQIAGLDVLTLVIRFRADVAPLMRLAEGDDAYHIVAFERMEDFLKVTAEKRST